MSRATSKGGGKRGSSKKEAAQARATSEAVARLEDELEAMRQQQQENERRIFEMRQELELARDWYQGLYDRGPAPCVTHDGAGIIEDMSHSAAALLGVDPIHSRGKPLRLYVALSHRRLFWEHLNKARVEGMPVETELKMQRRGGATFEAKLATQPTAGRRYLTAIVDLSRRAPRLKDDTLRMLVDRATGMNASRVKTEGVLSVAPTTAMVVLTVLEELGRSSAEYGALSSSAGSVLVRVLPAERDGVPALELDWEEAGAPREPAAMVAPVGLVAAGVAQALGGAARVTRTPAGTCCALVFPIPS